MIQQYADLASAHLAGQVIVTNAPRSAKKEIKDNEIYTKPLYYNI
jgi:hypothetical protein